ncbi:long-chain fatty acid--CoA ligase [Nisaea acidiphila]|uniref:Long-chain fatty acid--CoA ligase n=1 Tax=Nisaea acidiphila TaxID=1862145 RepID=A0A9J7AZX6_9PROT|nr:long-chain fatty acid--CoA ligase [Nisaea acidiphila]UUX50997.1 long-chain fatty acid--CoA ligase [Nisaea acidiphila]
MDYKAIRNLATSFFDQSERLADRPFLWAKQDGAYQCLTYGETRTAVQRCARGLRAIGIAKGDRVLLLSENRPEWVIADLAIMAVGAIAVPAYTTATTDDILFVLDHSGSKAAIVSTERLAKKLMPAARSADACETVISIEAPGEATQAGVTVVGWNDLISRGEAVEGDPAAWAAELERGEVCSLIYTSGTGGRPKGVMLTHGSLLANCEGAHDLLDELGLEHEVFLSLLPLSHSYEHACGLHFPISIGAEIYYAEGPEKVAQNLGEAKPTIMTAVPRLYEVLHDRIRRGVDAKGGLSAKLFHRAVVLGTKAYRDPSSLSLKERAENALLDALVRRKVSTRFGGRLKAFVSGGGALNPDIGTFFLSLGVRILQGYGQTEASPVVSCNRCKKVKIHTVGPPLKDVEVKIADDGEILVRGELLMKGYWLDPETTAKTIVDGWLYTGDIGKIDEDGYIVITDRKKDIIVNSGGDNISPARVEGQLTVEPEIGQAMTYGDKRPYLVAVLVPDASFVEEWAKDNGTNTDLLALAANEDFAKAIAGAMERANGRLSQIEKVRRFVLADEPFTTENAMMTPTLKIRRHKIREAYWERLDALYGRS